uniref:Uncharacterized protein n=1 Tax=Rhizophora mucronata TaxID=61149 RepID=A0A2P2P5P0_RHIMU
MQEESSSDLNVFQSNWAYSIFIYLINIYFPWLCRD